MSPKDEWKLLDEFAGRAMVALIEKLETRTALDREDIRDKIAERSYHMAQAMLDERRRRLALG